MSALYNAPADARRAVRRADRWLRANGGAVPPAHIADNETQATRQLKVNNFPATGEAATP